MKKVVIMYGGPSKESEVSIKSALNILENIDTEKYEVLRVFVTKDLTFKVLNNNNLNKKLFFSEDMFFKFLKDKNIDIVFSVLLGKYGEDGTLQKKLEENDIKFVGSGSLASKNAMDKRLSNKIFEDNNILIPKTKIIRKEDSHHNFSYPIFIKPTDEGSSISLFKINSKEEYENTLEDIFKNNEWMMLQECILGREFTCAILKINNKNISLPPTEIILNKSNLFDYKTKYTAGACSEVTPANVDRNLMDKIKSLALRCHEVLSCKDFSRTDIILDKNNNLYVLETNTVPGMTKTSFLPAQVKAEGLSMSDFINISLYNQTL